MELQLVVQSIFGQLAAPLCQLKTGGYRQPCASLSGHTAGQHVRHIIGLFQALEQGFSAGTVSYDEQVSSPLLFPRDTRAGGTWFAAHGKGHVAVLLNGAWQRHPHRLRQYRPRCQAAHRHAAQRHQSLVNGIIGLIFLVTALVQLVKMVRHKDA